MKKKLPITIVMITLNEEYHLSKYLKKLNDLFESILIVDSYSKDETIEIALNEGVNIVQRKFVSFSDQWNFAINNFFIKTPWTMKLDPDERLSDELIKSIELAINDPKFEGYFFKRRLWFLGKKMNIENSILRLWKTGSCVFSDTKVNEYPIIKGKVKELHGNLEHLDSANLEHWISKHNNYSSMEALNYFNDQRLPFKSNIFGNKYQRHMWLKKYFFKFPFKYQILYFYLLLFKSVWMNGTQGLIWLNLRINYFRQIEMKIYELKLNNGKNITQEFGVGKPDPRIKQY